MIDLDSIEETPGLVSGKDVEAMIKELEAARKVIEVAQEIHEVCDLGETPDDTLLDRFDIVLSDYEKVKR